jgi:uncharacterized membrane protein YjjB (DUF3815 family)
VHHVEARWFLKNLRLLDIHGVVLLIQNIGQYSDPLLRFAFSVSYLAASMAVSCTGAGISHWNLRPCQHILMLIYKQGP